MAATDGGDVVAAAVQRAVSQGRVLAVLTDGALEWRPPCAAAYALRRLTWKAGAAKGAGGGAAGGPPATHIRRLRHRGGVG